MDIVVCYKWVLDELDIRVKADSLALDTSRAAYKISDYDKNAIEEAVLLAERYGAKVRGLTYGGDAAKQSLKDALSRGLDEAYWIYGDSKQKPDGFVTANVLAAAVRKIGTYDLILCGEGASDTYLQQTAPRLASILGIPGITFVSRLAVEAGHLIATRKLGDCTELCSVQFPAVISVLPEINTPRIPSLKQVLGAAKKPVVEWRADELGLEPDKLIPRVVTAGITGYSMSRRNLIYKEKDANVNIERLVSSLAKEGVL